MNKFLMCLVLASMTFAAYGDTLKKLSTFEFPESYLHRHKLSLRTIIIHKKKDPNIWSTELIKSRLAWASSVLSKECSVSISRVEMYRFDIKSDRFSEDSQSAENLFFLQNGLDASKVSGNFENTKKEQTIFYLDGSKRLLPGYYAISGPESYLRIPSQMWNQTWIATDVLSTHLFNSPRVIELHELGHNLLDDEDHWKDEGVYNVMIAEVIMRDMSKQSNQFIESQCEKIRNHHTIDFE